MIRRLSARPATGALMALLVAAAASLALVSAEARALEPVSGSRTALAIVVEWGAGAAPAAPADLAPGDLVAGMDTFVNPYMSSVSRGQFSGWQADGAGPYTIRNPGSCVDDELFRDNVADRAVAAAENDGHDLDDYDNVIFYFSGLSCSFPGKAEVSGHRVWLQGKDRVAVTMGHELGHNLGLHHSDVKFCGTVPLRADCTVGDTDDPYSLMGAGRGSFPAAAQDKLGWIGQRHLDIAIPDDPQHLFIQPIEDQGLTIQALHLRDGGTDYWIELRAPIGVDVPGPSGTPAPGVLVRQSDAADQTHTSLLDMSPGNIFDAGLLAGRSWSNPLGDLRLTVNSISVLGADLTIENRHPRVPDVTWMRLQDAANALGAAGYSIGRTSYVVDASCSYVDLVKSQSPGAGNRVPTTQPIDLTFGTRPRGGCQ